MELFVGNVPYGYSKEALEELFKTCGDVMNIRMVMDRKTQKFKGFAFITMRTEAGERKALQLHDKDVELEQPKLAEKPAPSYGLWGRRRVLATPSRKLIVKPARTNRRFRSRKKVAR